MTQVHVAFLPMMLVLLTFFFVLLVILVAKSPKVGAWILGGLIFALPLVLFRVLGLGHVPVPGPRAIPVIILPATFLFVLLIVLIARAPKAGAVLIAVLVVMGLFCAFFFAMPVSHRESAFVEPALAIRQETASAVVWDSQARQQTQSGAGSAIVDHERVYEGFVNRARPSTSPSTPAPIWASGVDAELEADVYPSSAAAAQALGRRMIEPIRTVAGDPNATPRVILFQENNDRSLVAGFGRALEKGLPGASPLLEADLRNIRSGEVGVTFRTNDTAPTVYRVEGGVDVYPPVQEGCCIVATAFTEDRRSSAEVRLIDKPWVESFATFASARPQQAFIIARSLGTCTSEAEANQQALDDARARLAQAIGSYQGRNRGTPLVKMPEVTATDVLQGGFILDRFAQSLEGSAAKIWRQALLLDVSGPKLAQLARQKTGELRQAQMSWARMMSSAAGVLVLIGVIYFFLNMATRGYYEWSLRIACVVLAVVAVLSILMVVK